MGGRQKSLQMVTAAMKLKDACSLEKIYDQPRQCIKKQTHFFANKGPSSQSYGFSSSDVWTWELEYKESWPLKNWCFELWCWRKLLRAPWTSRKPSHSILKEISPEYLLKGLMLKLKLQYFGHLMWRSNLKRAWCWERLKGIIEDEMVGWHHQLDRHEFE